MLMSWSATLWRPSITRPLKKHTRYRGASQGRTGCATPPTTLTPPRRMITSAVTWRHPTVTWKRRPLMMSLANTVEFNCKREKTTKNGGYGQKEVVCTRTPKQDCYNIPRKIQVEVCKTDVHRYCEKFSNIFPFPVEKQNCHFEP